MPSDSHFKLENFRIFNIEELLLYLIYTNSTYWISFEMHFWDTLILKIIINHYLSQYLQSFYRFFEYCE